MRRIARVQREFSRSDQIQVTTRQERFRTLFLCSPCCQVANRDLATESNLILLSGEALPNKNKGTMQDRSRLNIKSPDISS